MAYNATYDSEDISDVVIDAGTKTLVQVAAFAAILGLFVTLGVGMAIYRWATKRK